METILKWISPVMAVGSIIAFWCEYKAQASLLPLLKWLSGFVWAVGNCLATYNLCSLGGIIGWVGQTLFLVFAIADYLRRNLQKRK